MNCEKWTEKTPAQLREGKVDLEMGLGGNWSSFKKAHYWPVDFFMPATVRINELSHRVKSHSEATLSIIAILRYRQDKNIYPDNLNELISTGYLKKLPMDVYSDKPLVYRKVDDDFTLYSLGKNFIDDGGQVVQDTDRKCGAKIWTDDGDAVFWPVSK